MKLNNSEQKILFDTLFPIGQVPYYDRNLGTIKFSETSFRRFIFDSTHVSRTVRPTTLTNPNKFNAGYLGFGFFESLSTVLQQDYQLYQKLFNFFNDADKIASNMISSCSHAAMVFSHKSFGERLLPHIHQDSGTDKKTLSIFFNLTAEHNEAPVLSLFDSIDTDSKSFKQGYVNHKLLLIHERNSTNAEHIPIENGMCILFNADTIPHALSYTNDIWVTIIYDHVEENSINFFNKGRYHVGSV